MRLRTDSASRRSCRAVEPIRSANTTVTTLRASWSSAPCLAGASTRLGTDSAEGTREAPQAPQDFAVGAAAPPQLAHRRANVAPHSSQKRLAARFSWPHDWQSVVIGGTFPFPSRHPSVLSLERLSHCAADEPWVPSARLDAPKRYVYT